MTHGSAVAVPAPIDLLIVIRQGDGLKIVRKHIENGRACTAVWRQNGHPLTIQQYVDGRPLGEPMPERRNVLAWAGHEAHTLLAEPG